jgi:putative colanic acid biosynthesis acetyltransferase WcaF
MDTVYQSELTFRNKLGRFSWGIIQATVFRFSPRSMHAWRLIWLRLFGAKIGSSAKVYRSVRIWAPWNLEMGSGSILGDRVDCYSIAPIKIGDGAIISQDSCLCGATHDHKCKAFTLIAKPVTINKGAWVAARAFVGPGVTVGEQAVVGACAVIFKDVPAGDVVVGNPACSIKGL